MKYSREYEKQADLVGAQIMARAGYDPRDLAQMFETIQKQGGGGGREWLSSHPNPGNRTQYINAGSRAAAHRRRGRATQGFQQVQVAARVSCGPARTMAEIERSGGSGGSGGGRIRAARSDASARRCRRRRASIEPCRADSCSR